MPTPSSFSATQLDEYFDHVQLPRPLRTTTSNPPRDYDLLRALHVHQLATIPYENLLLHYSRKREVSLDPQALWHKVMSGRGRGGYCMENCVFFNHILRACGFDAYLTGARIRLRIDGVPGGDYIGWMHIVNIVTLADGSRYMVDVSFGGDGATQPLPLIPEHSVMNLGTQEIRLVWDRLPEQISTSSKHWIYQYRNGPGKEWNSFYSFSETEWLEKDFEAPNYYVSQHTDSFQRQMLLVVKFLRNGNTIVGKRMLAGAVTKENLGGKTKVLQTCQTEEERVEVLKESFGILLNPEEVAGIRGFRTELPGH